MATAKQKTAIKIVVALVVLAVIIYIIWWALQPKTTTSSETSESAVVTSMTCTAGNIENPVFAAADTQNASYTINLLFRDDELSQLTYQYTATYDSEEAAEAQLPALLADYNLDLQDRGLSATYFAGTNIARVGNDLQVNFTADEDTLTPQVADYLLMDVDENGELPLTSAEVRANYVGKSFVCDDVVEAE